MTFTSFFRRNFPWIIVLAYVMLIYATLGSVRCLSDALRGWGLLGGVTLGILLLLCGVVIAAGLRRPLSRGARGLVVLLLGGMVSGTLFLLPLPEERLHVVEYGILGWLLGWALSRSGKWPTWWGAGVLLAWLIGCGDEMIQRLLPNRVFDVHDILLNGIAGMIGLTIFAILAGKTDGKRT